MLRHDGARPLAPGVRLLDVRRDDVDQRLRALRVARGVRYAERDHRLEAAGAPNDPSFGLQWPLQNTGQTVNGAGGIPRADEDVVPAWQTTTGSSSVVIGVIDSGLDYAHPDLAANVWSNPGGIGGCAAGTHGYNSITATCDPMDDDKIYGGHGTHVAGIIGGVGDNGTGITGVNWETSLLPVKFVNSSGNGSTSQLIAGLEWLIQAKQAGVNLRVINDSQTFAGTAFSQALADQIDRLAANDILFVTAAGNSGANSDQPASRRYPCGYGGPNLICVAATNQRDKLAPWSNYGANTVDLAAPGSNVYSTLRNGAYGFIRGTSMATAEVTGAAGLVLASRDESAAQVRADILDHVAVLPSLTDRVRTDGRLDICQAVSACRTETFGTTTLGAFGQAVVADRKLANRYSLEQSGEVTKLRVNLRPTANQGQQVIRGVIYADENGTPGALLGSTDELTFHSSDAAGWYDLTLPQPLTLQPGDYWIGILGGGTSKVARLRWDDLNHSRIWNTNNYASGPSNPFGSGLSVGDERYSLYAVYSAVSDPLEGD